MRDYRLVCALCMALLLALALVVSLSGCRVQVVSGTTFTSAPPCIVSSTSGQTLLLKHGSDTWVEASIATELEVGDWLKTGADAYALVVFFEGSVMEVGANTEILIVQLATVSDTGSTFTKVWQEVGNTVNRVQKLVDPASRYEVEMPGGSAVVRGTIFRAQVSSDGYSVVHCIEGEVWFKAGEAAILLSEGMESGGWPGGPPSTPSVGAATPTPTPTLTPTPTATPGVLPTPISTPTQMPSPTPIPTPTPTPTPSPRPAAAVPAAAAPPPPPPCQHAVVSSVPGDEFLLGDYVDVEGAGFAPSTGYNVWIVPYTANVHVKENDSLAGLPGAWNAASVTTAADGALPRTNIWQVPDDPLLIDTYYEIVVDSGNGVYNECYDGLDAIALDKPGFHIVPEALSIVLLSVGLASLGGYHAVRRRKRSETDA